MVDITRRGLFKEHPLLRQPFLDWHFSNRRFLLRWHRLAQETGNF